MTTHSSKTDISQWRTELEKKLKWLLLSRLIIIIVLFGAISIFLSNYQFLFKLLVIYGVVTLGYLGALYFWRVARKKVSFSFLFAIELFFEILIETAIVYFSGGESSPFTLLYMLTILSSAFFYELPGTIITATGAAIAYSALTYFRINGIIEPIIIQGTKIVHYSSDMSFAIAYIQVCFLYIVAFLAGYLSRKIRAHLGELEETKQKLERVHWDTDQIVQHMRSGLVTIDENGIIVYFNRSAGRILQIPLENIIDREFTEALPERVSAFTALLKQALKSATIQRIEIEIKDRYGQIFPLTLAISTLKVNEEIRGVIALFEDITEDKKRDELLQQMEKLAAIGELSARLAHELRNPLAAVRGGVEMLSKEIEKNNADNKISNLILKESDRLNQILENFLTFARLREFPPEYFRNEIVNVSEIIVQLIENIKTINNPENIEFVLKIPANVFVMGKREQLHEVFQNLFKNAIDAIGDKQGNITVSLRDVKISLFTKEELTGISIADNGIGIERDILPKIFEPFFTQKPKGTGLGLSIVQGIVNQNGGYVEVKSQPDKGSEFTVYLPKTKNIPK
ncbi:PAS domain S-box protein [bacterium]|nr:PAS domain S-box protein [bacterium]